MHQTPLERFDTLLVANRGEIALRVIRAARASGLRTVAVYSDADRDAPHVRAADTAVRIGPAPAAQSYLDIPALIGAAATSGAQAVHPGYGFLSENADFARACAAAGLVFVGPPADVIEVMGRKDRARALAVEAGVPVVPAMDADGVDGPDGVDRAVREIGLPLMVKASAGGGGKGMRVVRRREDLLPALDAARRESLAAFGDDALLIERYVERGRHIEVQVMADEHGHVVHVFERDCSVQRRHQKVVEEAPAPTIAPAIRERLHDAAVRLARRVGYVGAGTVEFLVEDTPRGGDAADTGQAAVSFLEMNTRLQVEHPVTELISGLDLVRLQLDVAQGAELPFTQDELTRTGHAIEVRVYAERPEAGFLPQAGRADLVHWPTRVRVDAALEPGQEVTTFYDPMLGKIAAHGPTRDAARRRLADALDDTAITGLGSNVGFLRRLVDGDAFRAAAIHTAWLDGQPTFAVPDPDTTVLCAAAWALTEPASGTGSDTPFGLADGWRLGGPPRPATLDVEIAGRRFALAVDRQGGAVHVHGPGDDRTTHQMRALASGAGTLLLEIDGRVRATHVSAVARHPRLGAETLTVVAGGEAYHVAVVSGHRHAAGVADDGGSVVAPMPGAVIAVHVAVGDEVEPGRVLGVMEAMKMELPLSTVTGGMVKDVAVGVGTRVREGQVLFTVLPLTDAATDTPQTGAPPPGAPQIGPPQTGTPQADTEV